MSSKIFDNPAQLYRSVAEDAPELPSAENMNARFLWLKINHKKKVRKEAPQLTEYDKQVLQNVAVAFPQMSGVGLKEVNTILQAQLQKRGLPTQARPSVPAQFKPAVPQGKGPKKAAVAGSGLNQATKELLNKSAKVLKAQKAFRATITSLEQQVRQGKILTQDCYAQSVDERLELFMTELVCLNEQQAVIPHSYVDKVNRLMPYLTQSEGAALRDMLQASYDKDLVEVAKCVGRGYQPPLSKPGEGKGKRKRQKSGPRGRSNKHKNQAKKRGVSNTVGPGRGSQSVSPSGQQGPPSQPQVHPVPMEGLEVTGQRPDLFDPKGTHE